MYSNKKKSLKERLGTAKWLLMDNTAAYVKSYLSKADAEFLCNGGTYKYARHWTNAAYSTERVVEIPLVMKYVNECLVNKGSILEVGNVLSHYHSFPHDTVDKYEKSKDVLNIDIVDYLLEKKYDLALSISTLEHVGYDEEEKCPWKILAAIEHMTHATKVGGKVIFTVPLGYNTHMDGYFKYNLIPVTEKHLMQRISCRNEWIEQPADLLKKIDFKYGDPFPYGNWILIAVIDVV
jgi:hypothetical protein